MKQRRGQCVFNGGMAGNDCPVGGVVRVARGGGVDLGHGFAFLVELKTRLTTG